MFTRCECVVGKESVKGGGVRDLGGEGVRVGRSIRLYVAGHYCARGWGGGGKEEVQSPGVQRSPPSHPIHNVDFTHSGFAVCCLVGRSDLMKAIIQGADFTNALVDRSQQLALCRYADGVNSVTGVSTRKCVDVCSV